MNFERVAYVMYMSYTHRIDTLLSSNLSQKFSRTLDWSSFLEQFLYIVWSRVMTAFVFSTFQFHWCQIYWQCFNLNENKYGLLIIPKTLMFRKYHTHLIYLVVNTR